MIGPGQRSGGGSSSSRIMSWRSSAGWGGDWNYNWDKRPKGKPEPKKKGDKKPGFLGHDGTPLRLPHGHGSASTSSSKEKSDGTGLEQIKDFLTDMARQGNFNCGHPLIAQLLEEDKDQELKDAQRALNNKRKAKKKVEQLRRLIASKDKDFKEWKHGMKTLLQEETKRHEENQTKLQQDLTKAEEAMERADAGQPEPTTMSDIESSEDEKEKAKTDLQQMQNSWRIQSRNVRCWSPAISRWRDNSRLQV